MNYERICKKYFELQDHFINREKHSTMKSLNKKEQNIKDRQKIFNENGAEWFYFEYLEGFDFGDKYYDELYSNDVRVTGGVILPK